MEAFDEKPLTGVKCVGGGYLLETGGYEYVYDAVAGAVTGVTARNLVYGQGVHYPCQGRRLRQPAA